jgi:hypothetical protein
MSSNHKIVNLSGGYITPRINELQANRKPWIDIGLEAGNDYFDTLIKRYNTSPTNQACIDGLTDLLYGKGLAFPDDEAKQEYLYSLTTENEIRKIVYDYKLFGNAAIQIHFSPDKQKIVAFYHAPVNNLRAEKCDEKGKINAYWYCSDWKQVDTKKLKPQRIPAFNSGEYEDGVQLMWLKRYSPGQFYYAVPDYYSGIQYCAVEEEISNLHINNILNNFLPTTIINFNAGLPPEEEQYQIEQDIKNKFVGTTNAGRFITSFNDNPEYKTTIDSVQQPNLHDSYKFLSEEAQNKIMVAHRITSQLLFGIKSATGFSSNADELKIAYDVLSTMVISPVQKELLDTFKALLEYNGVDATGILFDPLVPFEVKKDLVDSVGTEEAEDITQQPQVDTEDQESQPNEIVSNE